MKNVAVTEAQFVEKLEKLAEIFTEASALMEDIRVASLASSWNKQFDNEWLFKHGFVSDIKHMLDTHLGTADLPNRNIIKEKSLHFIVNELKNKI